MLLVFAKMMAPFPSVRDVKLSMKLTKVIIAVRHQMPPIRNAIGREGVPPQCVVGTGPIIVWVARLGLGILVSNTLIGDTR